MDDTDYAARIFLNAVVPLLKPLVAARPGLAKGFVGRDGVVQISYRTGQSDRPVVATHLIIDGATGALQPVPGVHRAPNLDLQFGSAARLVAFFKNKPALPRIRGGAANPRLLASTVRALLAMAKLLGSSVPPKDQADQQLLTTLMFYLLTTGISQLNKAGHPQFKAWANQPDRVYQFAVEGHDDIAAYVRVKAGRTKAFRGRYTRSKPFFTMAFDSPKSALGILLETDDMIESAATGKMVMRGAPEYGADLGDLMKLVGGYAK